MNLSSKFLSFKFLPLYSKSTGESNSNLTFIHKFLLIILTIFILVIFLIGSCQTRKFEISEVLVCSFWIISLLSLFLLEKMSKNCFKIWVFLITLISPTIFNLLITDNIYQIFCSITFPVLINYHLSQEKKLTILSLIQQALSIFIYCLEKYQICFSDFERKNLFESVLSLILVAFLVVCHISLIEAHKRNSSDKLEKMESGKKGAENTNTFLFSFFHEFRNVVGQIANSLELLNPNDKMNDSLHMNSAKVCCRLLTNLSNSFLDIKKIEKGNIEIMPMMTSSSKFFKEIWDVCQSLIMRKGLKSYTKNLISIPANIKIDCYRVSQILLNIVSNSVKCTEKGFIDIEADWIPCESVLESCFEPIPYAEDGIFEKNRVVTRYLNHYKTSNQPINAEQNLGILKFTISDSGCGMSEDKVNKLFQKFEQFSDDTLLRQAGAGLGLHISRSMCQLMRGEIRAFSKLECGTTIIVCIPCY